MPFFLSMIRPTLEYCARVWGSCGEVNSGTLETLQKRVGRIVIKGRTIRKVMGGGIFEPQELFSLSNSLYEFFLGRCMNIF